MSPKTMHEEIESVKDAKQAILALHRILCTNPSSIQDVLRKQAVIGINLDAVTLRHAVIKTIDVLNKEIDTLTELYNQGAIITNDEHEQKTE